MQGTAQRLASAERSAGVGVDSGWEKEKPEARKCLPYVPRNSQHTDYKPIFSLGNKKWTKATSSTFANRLPKSSRLRKSAEIYLTLSSPTTIPTTAVSTAITASASTTISTRAWTTAPARTIFLARLCRSPAFEHSLT